MKQFLQHFLVLTILLSLIFFIRLYFISSNNLNNELHMGLIHFKTFTNNSFIFGLFKNASHFVRIVLISVSLGIVTLLFSCFYAFLSRELFLLKWGMTILMAGMLGNGFEKLFYNHVIDYAFIDLSFLKNYVFNLSDCLQIAGLLIVIKEIFSKQEIIWFPNLRRQKVLIYKDIQMSVTLKILGIVFIGNLTQLILTVTLLFSQMVEGSSEIQILYIISFIILNFILLPILGYFLIKELLKCIGPVFALERHLSNKDLDGSHLKLRKSDYFHSLEDSFNKFVERNFNK
jgi:lipoprotein signal peptidase